MNMGANHFRNIMKYIIIAERANPIHAEVRNFMCLAIYLLKLNLAVYFFLI
jgi:hypothetical protein